MTRFVGFVMAVVAAATFLMAVQSHGKAAAKGTPMERLDSGIVMKVSPKSDRIVARSEPGGGSEVFKLEVLAPYFVMETEGNYYKITDVPASVQEMAREGNVGYVAEQEVYVWPTREALHFAPLLTTEDVDRVSIEAWATKDDLGEFLLSGDKVKFAADFVENQRVTRKKPKYLRPYPVLGKEELPSLLGREKLVYHTLFPTWVKGTGRAVVKATQEQVEKALKSVTFAIVFDSTGSMSPYAEELADIILSVVRSSTVDRDLVRVGFVFFRDIVDERPLEFVAPVELPEATRILTEKAKEMEGGGDAAEPVLDALVGTAARFDWVGSQGIAGSKRIAVVVLNSDAKLETVGLGAAIETGLTADDVARLLKEQEITAVTFQAGEAAGENLVYTLDLLATATGGYFAQHVGGDREATIRRFGSALKKTFEGKAKEALESGEDIARSTIPEGVDLTAIPLEVLDPEHLTRLRELAGDYYIDETGGLLINEGWIPGDENLLLPKISIDKETLNTLISFFNVLSTVDITSDDLLATVSKNLEGIIGENVSPDAPLDEIINRRLGINFQTDLLSYDINYLVALTPKEKAGLQKRMQDAGERLTTFLESSLAELDTEPTVWMPINYLP